MVRPGRTQLKPKISVILIDGSFREQFHALDFLAQQNLPAEEFEVLWIEYFDTFAPELSEKLKSHPAFRGIQLGRSGEYHSSYCFNAGISAARGELVFIIDADLAMEPDFLRQLRDLHQENDSLVSYCYRYNEPKEVARGTADLEHLKKVGVLTHPSNWGACIGVRRQWLLEVNGYEQAPVFASGDHGNDFDMYVRLKNLGLQICWPREPVLYHAWHPGTLHYAYSHKLQALVTRHRAFERSTLAYQGIDATRDRALPADLVQEIDRARERFEAERPDPAAAAPAGGNSESPPWLIQDHEAS